MSNILGGFDTTVWTSATETGTPTNIGIAARLSPRLNPNNLDIPGGGRRGFYDILLGTVDPTFSLDMQPTAVSFIDTYQDGQTAIPFLHYRATGGLGITFTTVYVNTMSLESRVSRPIEASFEFWAESAKALNMGSLTSYQTTPYRWVDSELKISDVVETEWHLWRYEVANNLERLPNVSTKGTREIVAKHRRVNGMIHKDLRDYSEFTSLMNVAADPSKFDITISLDGTTLLSNDCRWGTIEGPGGPEDLILKRFPFTALDLT